MALYLKQDFTPPILSRKWIAMKFRPNMMIYNRQHIISILESGLMFREDSIEVEQETPAAGEVWAAAGGGGTGWLTAGERAASAAAVAVCVAAFPPKTFSRSMLFHLAAYLSVPLAVRSSHRRACRGTLPALLSVMRDYLALARRAAACLKEYAALRAHLACETSAAESARRTLCRQQRELAAALGRASSALLGNAPWLRADVAWAAHALAAPPTDHLMKIHHAFLVVQSTFLKHVAMAHHIPSAHARKIYKNHNERIYWIHHTLIQNITDEFTQNYQALERMYRLLKNYGNIDPNEMKKPGAAIKDEWLYSEVHGDIARANLELKLALNKCTSLDMFLDACALQKQEIDLQVLNQDIDALVGQVTKCLGSAQSSQIRLRKLLAKFTKQESEVKNDMVVIENDRIVNKIDDKDPEAKDEVFYFVKTDDEVLADHGGGDITTGPGQKEIDATEIVLNELRRKLVNREDVMRERERQALAKTMPELKGNVPEFPRQIKMEAVLERKGYIQKIKRHQPKRRLFRRYKIQKRRRPYCHFKSRSKLKTKEYAKEIDIRSPCYEANAKLNCKTKLITIFKTKTKNGGFEILLWLKNATNQDDSSVSDMSDGLSDVEAAVDLHVSQAVQCRESQNGEARNYTFSRRDLELSSSSSEGDSEVDFYNKKEMALLRDVRRYRAARKKNHPDKRASIPGPSASDQDEGLRPSAYSLGAGLAMASVLQAGIRRSLHEEVFVGDGEVSPDSGNDDE